MNRVSSHTVVANVRTDGAIGMFEERKFDFMLSCGKTPGQKRSEALRILRQIGYETQFVKSIKDNEE